MATETSMTLLELNRLIASLMTVPSTQNVWVTAELSDVGVRNGHCYMELLQKDDGGMQLAKARAVIWANRYGPIACNFIQATGQELKSGLKVMLRVSATMHPVYGMSLVVSDINPEYTMGDLLRRRNEILRRLKAEGVIDSNRTLPWPLYPWRIAVISAPTAAGWGDFRDQLINNPRHLRFRPHLFPAIMQGEKAPASIIAQLEVIASQSDNWDCVVIIRGGGATSDLQAFEDYELAAAVAQFPIPVVIGIGHERDITVLDYVANTRVKTPTAAAEMLIHRGNQLLDGLRKYAADILQAATDRISGAKEQLSMLEGFVANLPVNAVRTADSRLRAATLSLGSLSSRRIAPALERLNFQVENLSTLSANAIARRADRLDSLAKLLEALSPEAVLSRGYSITRNASGHAVTSADAVAPGDTLVTTLARGTITSTAN